MTDDPIATFLGWHAEGVASGEPEPDAMTLATATPDGRVSARVVLFRGMQEGRFCFFTNYDSRKGREIAANAHGALVFHWARAGRQVRVEGRLERLSAEASDTYFSRRDRGHQLQALASPQSKVIGHLDEVRARHLALTAAYAGKPVTRPQYWGGFGLLPLTIELWTRGDDRLHLRRVFDRAGDAWSEHQLAP